MSPKQTDDTTFLSCVFVCILFGLGLALGLALGATL